ncbi:DUF262 domain-containing protein [Mucilaginibacter celer]|uniref:DUF262 domain-containing protein n=1 Tax=Mucilaginibacter celer TaxID=2305508 RepID=A0A494VVK7_9SPHI|nr:DUF262 domain-containing protein [Mucilaginibacter celer]AYL98111.1 DUF262 domain-containing protein [Mucilaginibacter celer]
MKITCIDKEIRKIFETGYYHIPRFQRPYSWEKDHISEFWNDTLIESETDYFIGSIVVYKKSDELYGIVDGQQRLTTITMILCSLRDAYRVLGFEKQARGVHSLIEKMDLNDDNRFILQTETSYPYFQEHIQKFDDPEIDIDYGSEEINLKNGFEQINGYIAQEIKNIKVDKQKATNLDNELINKLNEIRDKILKLKVIYIELDDEDDAYIIFETLNTRGKDLSVGDLVKNYLTKHIKARNASVDIPKDKWNLLRDNIEGTSSDLDIDNFLLHVWLSKYEYTTVKTLFKKIKISVKSTQASFFLNSLVTDSKTYRTIFEPDSRKWNKNELAIRNSLSTLYSFRVTQQTPMVLSIMREYFAGNLKYKYAHEALEAIEHFHYIFTAITSQRSSGGIGSMYSTYGRKLSEAKDDKSKLDVIRELKLKMREKLPTYDEFLASFKTIKFTDDYTKQKRIIQYTLAKVDKFYNKKGVAINYDLMTLEHLLPQNPSSRTITHDQNVGLLGNLILVDEQTNNTLANKQFKDKKVILERSNIFLDETIVKATKWAEGEIVLRTEKLASIVYNKVFKI